MLGLIMEQQAVRRATVAGIPGFRIERAAIVLPAANDPAQLARAADQSLVLISRNVQDFLRLNESWTVLREWSLAHRRHAGILLPLGAVRDIDWADRVMDLLLHPRCPLLSDQLLLWRAATGTWESDHPYSAQRRRAVQL